MDSMNLAPSPAPSPADIGICELSPYARAFSTVLTAFVGSIIGGLTSGFFSAFFTSWTCWLGTLRVVMIGLFEVAVAVTLSPLDNDLLDARLDGEGETEDPTILGLVGWLYSTCYAPTSQILWLVGNWNAAPGGLKIVRALGVSVTALPLTMDTKARYGAALEERFGRWSRCVFTLIGAGTCLVLGVIAAVELVVDAIELRLKWHIIVLYIVCMLMWTFVGFCFSLPNDGGKSGFDFDGRYSKVVAGLLMGAFGGLFTASPGYALMNASKKTPGLSLSEYVRCQAVALWRKFIYMFPSLRLAIYEDFLLWL